MTLIWSGPGLGGTVTESRITLNEDGTLRKADRSDDKKPKQITKAELDGALLRVTVADGFEFTVSLKDTTHGEIVRVRILGTVAVALRCKSCLRSVCKASAKNAQSHQLLSSAKGRSPFRLP